MCDEMKINGEMRKLGRTYASARETIAVEVMRYVLDAEGKETGTIVRVAGRAITDIVGDIARALEALPEFEKERLSYDYTALGAEYKYEQIRMADTPHDWPPHADLAVYSRRGGSEGHYVSVDVVIPSPEFERPRKRAQHVTIMTIKTFGGAEVGQALALKVKQLLGFDD